MKRPTSIYLTMIGFILGVGLISFYPDGSKAPLSIQIIVIFYLIVIVAGVVMTIKDE